MLQFTSMTAQILNSFLTPFYRWNRLTALQTDQLVSLFYVFSKANRLIVWLTDKEYVFLFTALHRLNKAVKWSSHQDLFPSCVDDSLYAVIVYFLWDVCVLIGTDVCTKNMAPWRPLVKAQLWPNSRESLLEIVSSLFVSLSFLRWLLIMQPSDRISGGVLVIFQLELLRADKEFAFAFITKWSLKSLPMKMIWVF